jgi:hypothetical protein
MLRRKFGGSTLTIAHKSNKGDGDRGLRGSSAFEAGFDTVLEIQEHRKDALTHTHTIKLCVKKQKSGEDGQTFYMQSRFVDTPEGSSLVLDPVSEDIGRAALDAKTDDRTLTPDMVDNVLLGITDGGHVSTDRLVEALSKRLPSKRESAIRKALERGVKDGQYDKFKAGHGRWALPEMIAQDVEAPTPFPVSKVFA